MAPKNIKALLGDDAYSDILEYSWKMTDKMNDFAQCLGLPDHDDELLAKNKDREKDRENVRDQMRGILVDWFEAEANKMTQQMALDKLIAACKHDNMTSKTNPLGHTLERIKSALPSMNLPASAPSQADVSNGTYWPTITLSLIHI